MPEDKRFLLRGNEFAHVKARHIVPVSVFKHKDVYARVGSKDILESEARFHEQLLEYGFPVPEIIEKGEQGADFYYLERSLGDILLGETFWKECQQRGRITDQSFSIFLEVVKQFARAQLKTIGLERNEESFYMGIHMNEMIEEVPDLKPLLLKAFQKAMQSTMKLPWVLSHGDLNPFNIFPKGVIDFGSSFHAPAGYDLVTCLEHTLNFPVGANYEENVRRRYEFDQEQEQIYNKEMEELYLEFDLPSPLSFQKDFQVCRMIWSAARVHKYPKLQVWRYEKLRNMVTKYCAEE